MMSSSSATLTLTNITTATMVHCCQGQQQEHHLWEDHGHGISSFFKFLLHHSPNITSVCGELSTQEEINKVDLADHIDEVEEFAEEELCRVPVVLGTVSMLLEEIVQGVRPVFL